MELRNICTTLFDKNVKLGEKITLVKNLEKTENNFIDQIVIEWLCSTIEYVSNTDKYIILNSSDINELLVLFNNRLKVNVFSTRQLCLKGNIFEILTRFFSQTNIINAGLLLNSWCLLLHNESWKENLTIKPNIDALAWCCECYINNQNVISNVDNEVVLSVTENLLECYLSYIRSQYLTKKIFSIFCERLLINVMCIRAICSSAEGKHGIVIACIDKLLTAAVCSKEHIMNLKVVLKSEFGPVTPAKKMKVDETCDTIALDDIVQGSLEKKVGKPAMLPKDDLYFQLLFKQLSTAKPELHEYLLKTLPMLYKTSISIIRSSESTLTNYEKFHLMIVLTRSVKLKESLGGKLGHVAMLTLVDLFDMVVEYNVYQALEDTNSIFHNWMSNLVNIFLDGFHESDEACQSHALKIMITILDIKHTVLEPFLPQLWNLCLKNNEEDIDDLQNVRETFLCHLLATYVKLHQLSNLISSFGIIDIKPGIVYPKLFLERFKKSVSELWTSQINDILDIYLAKLKVISTKAANNVAEISISTIEHLTYLLCYVVIMNASVIPGKGYTLNSELPVLIEKLETLKQYIHNFTDTVIKPSGRLNTGSQGQHEHVRVLVQHGINNIVLLLKQCFVNININKKCFAFDLADVGIDKDLDNPILKYLMVSLTFDQINHGTISAELFSFAKNVYKDASEGSMENTERWNGQIFCITNSNCTDALVKLFNENMTTVLAYNDEGLIMFGFRLLWKCILHWRKVEKTENQMGLHVLRSLPGYNNIHYQLALLSSINESLTEAMKDDERLDIDKLLKEEVEVTMIIEFRRKYLEVNEDITDIPLPDIEWNLFHNIFNVILQLPLEYFTELNLFTLSVMVLKVWDKLKKMNLTCINCSCIQILGKVMEIYAVESHTSCLLPFGHIFSSQLEYAIENKLNPNLEAHLMSSFASATKAIVKYAAKGEVSLMICNKLMNYLIKEDIPEMVIVITERMLSVLSQLLTDPTIKARSEQNAYQILFTMSETLLCLIFKVGDKTCKYTDSLFSIYANLCKITQHAQVRNSANTLKFLDDKIANAYLVVSASVLSRLNTPTDDNKTKYLQVIEFVYSSSHWLSLRLRVLLPEPETELVPLLIKKAESNLQSVEIYGNLISNIVLHVGQSMIGKLLYVLAEKLLCQLKGPHKETILKIWLMLLKSKWEKDQRITLWEYLPKVMLACVHITKTAECSENLIMLIRVLTSAVVIGKNSLMSQYVGIIYHVFAGLNDQVVKFNFSSFVQLFEEIYQLISQLLFHHQQAIFSSFHAYINTVNSLLEVLISYSMSRLVERNSEELQKCCERMSRLYREIGSHKGVITEYAPFIVSRYISQCLCSSLSRSNLNLLEHGIYCIMDTFTQTECAFLNTTLETADKEYYKVIKNNYEKHKYKFTDLRSKST